MMQPHMKGHQSGNAATRARIARKQRRKAKQHDSGGVKPAKAPAGVPEPFTSMREYHRSLLPERVMTKRHAGPDDDATAMELAFKAAKPPYFADGVFTAVCACGATDRCETWWFPTAHAAFMARGWKYTPQWFCPRCSGKPVKTERQAELSL